MKGALTSGRATSDQNSRAEVLLATTSPPASSTKTAQVSESPVGDCVDAGSAMAGRLPPLRRVVKWAPRAIRDNSHAAFAITANCVHQPRRPQPHGLRAGNVWSALVRVRAALALRGHVRGRASRLRIRQTKKPLTKVSGFLGMVGAVRFELTTSTSRT